MAARELFAGEGLTVTMREVARRAGIGPATLYRHFPTKQDLAVAAFVAELGTCRSIVAEAEAEPIAWSAFCLIIERVTVLNAQNQGFTDAFLSTYPNAVDFRTHRLEMVRGIAAIARRAQATGALRRDFVLEDFVVTLAAGRGLLSTPPSERTRAARRFAALTIDAFRAADAHGDLPAPPHLSGKVLIG